MLLCEQSVAWRRCGGRDAASGCCPEAPLRAALCALLSLLGVLSGALCVSLCFFVTVGSRPAVSASLPLSVRQRQQRRETEAENEDWLDNGQLGTERRLFYRELIARFGHHPAIRWNLCEENDFSASRLDQFAAFITAIDSNESIISVHNNPNDIGMF